MVNDAPKAVAQKQVARKPEVSKPQAGTGRMRQSVVAVVSVLLVAIIVTQALLFFHVPLSNVFASHGTNSVNNTSYAAPSVPQVPKTTVVRSGSFETGIVTPQWQQQTAYNASWQQSVSDIQTQTGGRWIELSLLFSQPSSTSTTVQVTQSTPLVSSFAAGIRAARAKGMHVFVVPLMGVNEPGGWAGSIHFSTQAQAQSWFDSYWNTYRPYVEAAAQAGADQMAIATECAWLQQNAPSSLWNQLITRIRSVYAGTLTYDMNWYPTNIAIPDWFGNANLSMIGVSSYFPLVDTSTRIDPSAMVSLWHTKVLTVLDNLSTRIGKPVLISEIGYRNSSDALYQTWDQNSMKPLDPQEQAGAYNAALTNAIPDKHIAGIFFWGWQDVGRFTLKGQSETLAVLHKWYTSVGA